MKVYSHNCPANTVPYSYQFCNLLFFRWNCHEYLQALQMPISMWSFCVIEQYAGMNRDN
jgi:hypothetical protein